MSIVYSFLRILAPLTLICIFPFQGLGRLEFSPEKNEVQLLGPFLVYNVLEKPYSLGPHPFKTTDFVLKIDDGEEPLAKRFSLIWPRFLLDKGRVEFISKKGKKVFFDEDIELNPEESTAKIAKFKFEELDDSLMKKMMSPFRVCIEREGHSGQLRVCTDQLKVVKGRVKSFRKKRVRSRVSINGKKALKNAQFQIPPSWKEFHLLVQFETGFMLDLKEDVRKISIENIFLDLKTQTLGVVLGDTLQSARLKTRGNFFSQLVKERNYYDAEYAPPLNWSQTLASDELVFTPFEDTASLQFYGFVLKEKIPAYVLELDEENPKGTYSDKVLLTGKKAESEKIRTENGDEINIFENQQNFTWNFSTQSKEK